MAEDTNGKTFDPSRYLTMIGNAQYLEVKWRLVWLREVHPDAIIETELLAHTENSAIVFARITIPGGGSATGIGSETYDDFRDFHEKCETKAIGRALAALGFGTQFCPDHDFGASEGKVVDSPIDFAANRGRRFTPGPANGPSGTTQSTQEITPRQIKFIEAMARERGIADAQLATDIVKRYGKALPELTRRDASAFIEILQAQRNPE